MPGGEIYTWRGGTALQRSLTTTNRGGVRNSRKTARSVHARGVPSWRVYSLGHSRREQNSVSDATGAGPCLAYGSTGGVQVRI
eukprot:6093875-Pyramimonas_sp.AAC.1